jgi:hypothetical protein
MEPSAPRSAVSAVLMSVVVVVVAFATTGDASTV